ncbi:MAG TPA: carboxymuconolactone decarboxylase family protein [Acidocella sp.]|jgi:AhpD family alkylhydroperoxidase|nr:carboxymuconolactone decarboxylase family protein [Acidocella sp.]
MSYENFSASQKEVVAALRQMSAAATAQGLEKELVELVKIRISQINGCAFCLQFHLKLARQLGVEERKLGLLAAWRESGAFSAREMAALAYGERLTLLGHNHLHTEDQTVADAEFSAGEIEHLTIAIATINAWNRIAAALHFSPPA